MTRIATVINFCTHDLRFLDKCISRARVFSDQIVIPVCDHLYNGRKEDPELLKKIYQKYPGVDFVEFAYSEEEVYGTPSKLVPGSPFWSLHWHNSARLIASYFLGSEIEYVLFLDVDEIVSEDLRKVNFEEFAALRFAVYWYFKTASNCATTTPDGALLIRKDLLSTELIMNQDERMGMFARVKERKKGQFSLNGKPIIHHYSWVRTQEEMLSKVRSWGHHWERDWEALMQQEGDFVRKYSYKQVDPFWDPLEEKMIFGDGKGPFPNVQKVSPKEVFRMEISRLSNSAIN